MRLPETRDMFARELEFPVSCAVVVEQVGDVRLEAPGGGIDGDETVGEILGRCSEQEFRSSDELYDSLVGLVSEEFVGRKHYDDRGSQPADPESEVSF